MQNTKSSVIELVKTLEKNHAIADMLSRGFPKIDMAIKLDTTHHHHIRLNPNKSR